MSDADRDARDDAVLALLRAVRDFGDAHDRMTGSMKHGMDMNVTDLAALRLLIMREDQGVAVTPADIARHLRISTASTTTLLDRLEAADHIVRAPHPTDRRARVVHLTDHARAEFFRLFSTRLTAMREAIGGFSDEELRAATRVLDATASALDPD
ncbi:MarR family winged helix-turn-helix transcriptional regulator [Microbacterium sp. ASV49]|uniref:MarR family transcriptional regulator n=1 Tax=Microbacterium candidum TaxID=3041922 RepID=A0ABT7N484_9MICO|nr:MarR family transcriptional regulator [Microbacterium sp. ASV49]MDL9981518.1 MarR family transcriptional regulator [Microbacterium sp. ASV49]